MHKQQAGFTLIELMLTLTVMAVVLAIAVPSFNSQIRNNRSLALGEDLVTAFNFARSEAVKRGRAVTVCASNTAHTACSNSTDTWTNGWLVLLDNSLDTATTITPGDVLRVWDTVPDNAAITVARTTSGTSTAAAFVRYTGVGVLAQINNSAAEVSVNAHTTGCVGNAAQQITIGVAGVINISRVACADDDE